MREVGHVHVVDDVVGGAEEPERAGRLERRAVLDVALLDPVVPVHAGIQWRSAVAPVAISDVQTGVTDGKPRRSLRSSAPA